MNETTPVLIVGGSMVGLASALFLARQGVRPLLVERHERISAHPRAQAASPRTMELLRPLGLEEAVRAAENPHARYGDIMQVESLAGRELGRFDGPFRHDVSGASAVGWTLIGQDKLEPILRERAERLGADIRFGVELVSHEQDEEGVTAVIRSASGRLHEVRARYLIAADGNRSPIRERAGIGTHGRGAFGRQMIVVFRADLRPYVAGRAFFLCFVSNPQVHGVLGQLGAEGSDRWCIAPSLDTEDSHQRYDEARCVELVRAAVGVPDLPVQVESADSWEIAARVADSFRDRRVFLAGDSAHVMPPTGGFGGNMGVQDAHNLAWKLALVLRGLATPALLDSYEAERLPVAEFCVEQGVIRYLQRSGLDSASAARHRPEATVLFGHVYRSAATLPGDTPDPAAGEVVEDPTQPSASAGTRAPRLRLLRGGAEVDVHDLVAEGFTLLTGAKGTDWVLAARQTAVVLGVEVAVSLVGSSRLVDLDGVFAERYQVEETGAVLVRPDGFIAWRCVSLPPDPPAVLTGVMARVLGRRVVLET